MERTVYNVSLLALCLFLAIGPASASDAAIPGDFDGDKIVSDEEMMAVEASFEDGSITSEKLEEIRHIHEEYPRTIIDTKGREVTIYKPVKTVGCTISQHLETLRTLQVPLDMVVIADHSISHYSYFSDFSHIPSLGHFHDPDVEAIVQANPDLLIVHPGSGGGRFGAFYEPFMQKMEGTGITVACLALSRPDIYPEEVEKLGVLLEKEEEATEFLDFYKGILGTVEERTKDLDEEDRPKVYCEHERYTTSDNNIDPIEMAGGRFIFDLGQTTEIDPEAVVSANPDVIIRLLSKEDPDGKIADDTENVEAIRQEILDRQEMAIVNAVKNKEVYLVASPLWTYLPYSGCRHFIGVAYAAKILHPELFEDFDPKAIHQRYLTEFQRIDYDLEEKGVFLYPEP
ncbi:MAG: Periplasmic binding protein [Methanothrix sp.]|jgi:iron complex transport system substrate-binding protein|nr:MAG: Periplasmic binding protein [Methanothrix sp.]